MWVGQCRHIPDSTVRRPVAVFYDETVPPFRLQKDTVQNELRSHGVQKDGYRMITKLWGMSSSIIPLVTKSNCVARADIPLM